MQITHNMYRKYLVLLLVVAFPVFGQEVSTKVPAAPEPSAPEEMLLQRFTDSKGTVVGVLVGTPIKGTPGAFESFRFLSPDEGSVLYRVTRTALFSADGKIDEKIHDDGSRGFTLEVVRYNYVHIGCCAIGGGAMDGLNIRWKEVGGKFELSRTP